MFDEMMLYGGAFAGLGVLITGIMIPPNQDGFYRVAALMAVVGFFAGACLAEAVAL